MRCVHADTCLGSKPFRVGFNNPRFRFAQFGQITSDCRYCPGYEPEEEPRTVEVIHRHSDIGPQEYDLLQQTARRATNIEKQLNEHIEISKKQAAERKKKKGEY